MSHTSQQKSGHKAGRRSWRLPKIAGIDVNTIASLLGIVALFSSFFPHLTLSEPMVENPEQFFSQSMTVTNDGILPVFHVECGLIPYSVYTDAPAGIEAPEGATVKPSTGCDGGTLVPGDAFTFDFEFIRMRTDYITKADFDISIRYVPLLPPIPMRHCVHFIVHRDSAGHNHWFRSPGQCSKFPWL